MTIDTPQHTPADSSLWTWPNALCLVRLVGSPVMVVLAFLDMPRATLGLFAMLIFTDLIDGRLARRVGQRTSIGARLDSVADMTMYTALTVSMARLLPELLWQNVVWLALPFVAYWLNVGVAWLRFRHMPSYHTRAAKLGWAAVICVVITLLGPGWVWPLRIAAAWLVLVNIEAVAISLTLDDWQTDVPSWWHARRLRETSETS